MRVDLHWTEISTVQLTLTEMVLTLLQIQQQHSHTGRCYRSRS
jgi:hypothetical protein